MKSFFTSIGRYFKSFYEGFKKEWAYHLILTLALIGAIIFVGFNFGEPWFRFKQVFIDIKNIFTAKNSLNDPLAIVPPGVTLASLFPISLESFMIKINSWWHSLFNGENFKLYLILVLKTMTHILQIVLIIIPVLFLLNYLFELHISSKGRGAGVKSNGLKAWQKFSDKVLSRIKNFFSYFFEDFIPDHKLYIRLVVFVLGFYFNVYSIVLAFFTWYLYFCFTLSFVSIPHQLFRLFIDLRNFLDPFVFIFVLIFVLYLIDRKIKKDSYARLSRFEKITTGQINSWGNTIAIFGFTRKGKTTMLSTIAVLKAKYFRHTALESMDAMWLKWNGFPFIKLEKMVAKAVEDGRIRNLASCREFVKNISDQDPRELFGYDYERYGLSYYDSLKEVFLYDALEEYACLYFIYSLGSSLIFGNLSIRDDGEFKVLGGGFPIYQNDFFEQDVYLDEKHNHSHILHFDSIRLFRKLFKDNPYAFSFDFGVVAISEIAKEVLNSLEKQEMKKGEEQANQKNDGLARYIEMHGHASTVDYKCFSQFVMDEQRSDKLGIDIRGICSAIVTLEEVPDECSYALGFYRLRPLLYEKFIDFFGGLYFKFRIHRQDETLVSAFVRSGGSIFQNKYLHNLNTFGYKKIDVILANGQEQDSGEKQKFILMNKIAYSDLFDTAVFRDYFYKKTSLSSIGINDVPTFEKTKATLDEMKSTESYFFLDLLDPNWRVNLKDKLDIKKDDSESKKDSKRSNSKYKEKYKWVEVEDDLKGD